MKNDRAMLDESYSNSFVSFVVFVVRNWPWFGEKLIDFVVVGFEWVAHDQEIAAVVRDRVPVDDVGLLSILEVSDGASPTRSARVGRRNASRVCRLNAVVPFADPFARRNAEEQALARIDVVIFEIETLQPRIGPLQFFRRHE